MNAKQPGIEALLGKVLHRIDVNEAKDEIRFITTQGDIYLMSHHQDCCENVYVDDITGDLSDLIGKPILKAEEESSDEARPGQVANADRDSFTWTFYKLATIKGYVDIRWYGESNGYYSESVNIDLLDVKDDCNVIDMQMREVREIK